MFFFFFFIRLVFPFVCLFFARLIFIEISGVHEGAHHRFDSCLDDALLTFHVQHVECSRNVIELRAAVQECVEILF